MPDHDLHDLRLRVVAMQTALTDIGAIVLVKAIYTETELRIVEVLRRVSSHVLLPDEATRLFGVWITPSEVDSRHNVPTWATQSEDGVTWKRAEFHSAPVAARFAKMASTVGRPDWRYEVREIPAIDAVSTGPAPTTPASDRVDCP